MTNTARNRFAIDLDEIDRNLSAPATPAGAKNDPLSELARIVGQDDPFRSILKAQPAPAARANDGYDDLFAARDDGAQRRYAEPSRDFEAELAASLRAPVPVGSPPAGYHAHHQPADLDWVQANGYAQPGEAEWDPSYAAPAPKVRRSRKGLLAVAAVLGVAALGVTSALVMGVGRPGGFGGEPPLIKAQVGPLKVQPENPGGVEFPNQNKQIYERAAAEKTKVVNREEQPLDVAQATRQLQRPAPAPAPQGVDSQAMRQAMQAAAGLVPPAPASAASSAPQPNAAGMPSLGEPRRVRTVSVRPDGSIVTADGAAAAAPMPPMRPTSMPQAQPPSAPPTRVASAAPVPTPMPTTTASTPTPPARQAAPATTPATPPAPVRTASIEPARPAAPATKEQQRLANLPVAPAPAPAADDDAPAARPTSGGGFVVQLGVSSSESQARDAFNQFRSKYGAALSGTSPGIVKAEVNGNTIYRVRTAPMDRGDANEACSKIKASGGSCFVAKN
ncbi:SPOR domain-containing protein [Salinarimonas soli]|uniref:SPOR domain-containing protein n=1 Tax=Salinarimonas soli TaxID=1638099 RepID=A0A5B2V8Q1_9HYPH|nr:SPOR domain-containing protein [Salinarimonas soli]KAA2235361.1 SPOR domain-containing protein [Salinarimonas soli]